MVVSTRTDKRVSDWHANSRTLIGATLFRWTPNDKIEFIPFTYFNQNTGEEAQPYILPAGAALPPRFDRGTFFSQGWADRHSDDFNTGALLRTAAAKNWRVQAALLRSVQ